MYHLLKDRAEWLSAGFFAECFIVRLVWNCSYSHISCRYVGVVGSRNRSNQYATSDCIELCDLPKLSVYVTLERGISSCHACTMWSGDGTGTRPACVWSYRTEHLLASCESRCLTLAFASVLKSRLRKLGRWSLPKSEHDGERCRGEGVIHKILLLCD